MTKAFSGIDDSCFSLGFQGKINIALDKTFITFAFIYDVLLINRMRRKYNIPSTYLQLLDSIQTYLKLVSSEVFYLKKIKIVLLPRVVI